MRRDECALVMLRFVDAARDESSAEEGGGGKRSANKLRRKLVEAELLSFRLR